MEQGQFWRVNVSDVTAVNGDHPLWAETAELLWDREVSECRKDFHVLIYTSPGKESTWDHCLFEQGFPT